MCTQALAPGYINVYPGAGAWVHNVYPGAGAWVDILAPFALSGTRLKTRSFLLLLCPVFTLKLKVTSALLC